MKIKDWPRGFGLPRYPKLILSDGEKGGVGKSFAKRALTHTMLARGLELVGFDADTRNSHLARFYGETITVNRIYLRDRKGWDGLIDVLGKLDEYTDVVIDLPANMGEILAKEAPRLLMACERKRRSVHRMWVMGSEYDSVAQLSASKNVFPLERTFVVKNGLYGNDEDFQTWQGSNIQKELHNAQPAEEKDCEILLPAMAPSLRGRISSARCSFSHAAKLPLTLSEQIDLQLWLASTEAAFEPILEQLGL
ncbi:hypothetical protein GGQ97_001538 [Sphingomonas kaistensis]|uniref:CobQ/CobB/MinD/ParA nucleotide binding domain-containing protein n=1 Tax=Sphingomonas kaistensis TaxID=298708 RepID=A0A7X5Y6K9_9SPHN|nr:hypothetical protein [Sphingomonas kaistensis]NJC05745.1 hypothetical protein [Sphingomonas kaistensis]